MARPLRVEFPGALYLVTARTLPRQKLARDPAEVEDFTARFPALAEGFQAVFHGFCLLADHYHLLVETPLGNLSRVIHRLNAGYTATANARRCRRGPLLQSRYRALLLDADPWLLRLSVRVHTNPLRRKLASDPWSYPGSSARAFAPTGAAIPGIETYRVLELAGGREAYRELVETALREPPKPPWEHVWRQTVLGGEALRERVLAAVEGRDPREIPGFTKGPEGLTLDTVLEVVAEHTGVAPGDVLRGKFQRVLARKAAICLARRFTALTLREIGEAFGVDYTTVHMAARRVDELRSQNPAVEEFLAALEADLRKRIPRRAPEPAPGPGKGAGRRKRKVEEEKPEGRDPKASAQLKLF